jgi:hypothetical protein
MGKKKGGKSKGNVSNGVHSCVSSKLRSEIRQDYLKSADRVINQSRAHSALKNVMVTIPNPNTNETNRRFIRVPANIAWGKPKIGGFSIR